MERKGYQVVVVGIDRAEGWRLVGIGRERRDSTQELQVILDCIEIDVATKLVPAEHLLQLAEQKG